eukprot:s4235_g2.t3
MDNNEKLDRLLEALGPGADRTLAEEVLRANGWNLSEALNLLVGEGAAPEPQRAAARPLHAPFQTAAPAVPVAPAPIPAAAAPTGTFATGFFGGGRADEDVRAPMRTGFHETLLTADPAQQRRQDEEREADLRKREAERIAAEERKRQQEEETYNKGLARLAEEQRSTAEKQALERKKQKMEEEQAKARQRRLNKQRDDSEEEEEDFCVAPPMGLADLSAQLAGVEAAPAPAPSAAPAAPVAPAPRPPARPPDDDDEELEDIPVAPAVPLSHLAAQVGTGVAGSGSGPAPAPPAEMQPEPAPAVPPVAVPPAVEPPAPSATPPPAEPSPRGAVEGKAADPVVQALKELRKRYREADPAALAAGLRIVSGCVGHLVTDPQEAKYHRINCAAGRFRTSVESLEGAVAVLEAAGFRREGSSLVVEKDFPRTHGLQLRDAKARIDVVLGELEAAGHLAAL